MGDSSDSDSKRLRAENYMSWQSVANRWLLPVPKKYDAIKTNGDFWDGVLEHEVLDEQTSPLGRHLLPTNDQRRQASFAPPPFVPTRFLARR
jgi:hypothetical protein